MAKLKALQVRNAKGPCKLSDGHGLYFEITTSGVKRWLYRYKIQGKESTYILDRYPDLSLEEARRAHAEARKLVKSGRNPAKARREKKLANIEEEENEKTSRANSFHFIALEWIEQQRNGWSANHSVDVFRSLENNVFPYLGTMSVEVITPPDVLAVLRKVEARGSLEIARKVLQRTSAVFRYAIQTGRATYNPAADMKGVLKAKSVEHMPAVFDRELSQLLKDIAANQKMHITTKLALQFTAHTACRSGEVRYADWSEIDAENKEWHIPAERMKMRRAHIVPLSRQAFAILERARALFGDGGLIFPSVRDRSKPMSDNAMSKALRDMGYKGKATPHGFRSSFSSMAYEKSGFPSEVIEKSLAHEEKNKIKGAYNRAEYLEQRRQLMQWWGNKLQILEDGGEIVLC